MNIQYIKNMIECCVFVYFLFSYSTVQYLGIVNRANISIYNSYWAARYIIFCMGTISLIHFVWGSIFFLVTRVYE